MSALQERIFNYLTDAFIADRSVDPVRLASSLQAKFPNVPSSELADTVRRIASGLGVKMKEPHHFTAIEADADRESV